MYGLLLSTIYYKYWNHRQHHFRVLIILTCYSKKKIVRMQSLCRVKKIIHRSSYGVCNEYVSHGWLTLFDNYWGSKLSLFYCCLAIVAQFAFVYNTFGNKQHISLRYYVISVKRVYFFDINAVAECSRVSVAFELSLLPPGVPGNIPRGMYGWMRSHFHDYWP